MTRTVLIADDAIFMRTMIGDILKQAGFEGLGRHRPGSRRSSSTGISSRTSSRWIS